MQMPQDILFHFPAYGRIPPTPYGEVSHDKISFLLGSQCTRTLADVRTSLALRKLTFILHPMTRELSYSGLVWMTNWAEIWHSN